MATTTLNDERSANRPQLTTANGEHGPKTAIEMHPVIINCRGDAHSTRWVELACRRCEANAHKTDSGEVAFFQGFEGFEEHMARAHPDLDVDRSKLGLICYKNDLSVEQVMRAASEYRDGRYSKLGQHNCHLHYLTSSVFIRPVLEKGPDDTI